ncbi:3-carboxy-cis,cis-muconate cycloisomerase [Roseibium sp. TrichSKD4]|uniref:lyase family protein n=1 Tax=Roseibium sp. TrichSKD4 TaxID=744980 RepID=UPI0001E56E37|nr:lyase family protein [Roseibium sp. TrichSKD4]EFO30296.1 3-carboxy-cis,cis-muconate cycloisomerase [Roseibium sp. TrichSKD4]
MTSNTDTYPAPDALTHPIFFDEAVSSHFTTSAVLDAMIRVELALARVQAELGIIPGEAAEAIQSAGRTVKFPDALIAEGVAKSGVPVPVLVDCVRQEAGERGGGFVHLGATSQDIIDTAFGLCYRDALEIINTRLGQLLDRLEALSSEYAETVMMARTRGQLATPITLGLRIAQWAQPLVALENELGQVRKRTLKVQFGGASGSRSALGGNGKKVSDALAEVLQLEPAPPWHTDRSGVRQLAAWLEQMTCALAKIGKDTSLSARGEIAEISAGPGGGSSAMPHKHNPVVAEFLQSIQLLAQALGAGLSASSVQSEDRDGVAWPLEWHLMPQLLSATAAALNHALVLLADFRPDMQAMKERVLSNPEAMAETAVAALSEHMSRQEAAERVKAALRADEGFVDAVLRNAPSPITRDRLFDLHRYLEPAKEVSEQIFASRTQSNCG